MQPKLLAIKKCGARGGLFAYFILFSICLKPASRCIGLICIIFSVYTDLVVFVYLLSAVISGKLIKLAL